MKTIIPSAWTRKITSRVSAVGVLKSKWQTIPLSISLSPSPCNQPLQFIYDTSKSCGSEGFFQLLSRTAGNYFYLQYKASFIINAKAIFSYSHMTHTGMASYGTSNQKPEWKRYKQYTRNDIMAAIEAVRAGMSALQAARKYGVPSRTLYDKVKKLGITTNRPYRKGSFPMSPYQGLNLKMEEVSGYSPEEPLDVSSTGNGNGNIHGQEGDSDKMDSDPGSSSIKQEHSPRIEDLEESPHYERQEETNPEPSGELGRNFYLHPSFLFIIKSPTIL